MYDVRSYIFVACNFAGVSKSLSVNPHKCYYVMQNFINNNWTFRMSGDCVVCTWNLSSTVRRYVIYFHRRFAITFEFITTIVVATYEQIRLGKNIVHDKFGFVVVVWIYVWYYYIRKTSVCNLISIFYIVLILPSMTNGVFKSPIVGKTSFSIFSNCYFFSIIFLFF